MAKRNIFYVIEANHKFHLHLTEYNELSKIQ